MNSHPRAIDGLTERQARRIVISGRVQGVGFRPFIFRLAERHGLTGWVRNCAGRVQVHAEGDAEMLSRFEAALIGEAPLLSRPRMESSAPVHAEGAGDFRILASESGGEIDVHLPPDLFCCDDCVAEMQSVAARRHRYPFTNCTQCGPRYTIIRSLPYDRPGTAMAGFALCPACRAEYENPADRRFHAQPLACPDCGPQLRFHRQGEGEQGEAALKAAIACLKAGFVVAVKGVGGYHLMCDAASDAAVNRLRQRKGRPDKPLAVMFPQRGEGGLAAVREHVRLDSNEARILTGPERPILLARRRDDSRLSWALAPGLAELGVFLPYSPLHHLLLGDFDGPLVATSGNISGEPVITDNDQALRRLAPVADAFLDHDRPILRPADDSVIRVIGGKPRPIRVGRGIAPLEIELPGELREPVLAVGGHMKNAVALGWGRRAVLSPHIGELDSPRSLDVFETVIADLQAICGVEARHIVCDLHPRYASTRWARTQRLPLTAVQHHAAHASALAGEHPEISRWLVFTWDGLGLGSDGSLWGGEAFLGGPGAWRRAASLRPFHLPGGERAGREPWRSAAAVMWESGRDWRPDVADAALAGQAWRKRIGTSPASSVGRLFDAAAALTLGLAAASYEGQGPMMLEAVAQSGTDGIPLRLYRDEDDILRSDWTPLLDMLSDQSLPPSLRAGIFHESLARALAEQVAALAQYETFEAVGLAGGVFQNHLLADRAMALVTEAGFACHLPQMLPANDGGLAYGQLVEWLGREGALS
jgi:hydrogenase maturation protein HypF